LSTPASIREFDTRWNVKIHNYLRRYGQATAGGVVVLIAVATAALAPLIAPHDAFGLGMPELRPPGGDTLLGTDALGRDVLSRLIYGTRVSITVGVLAAGLGLLIGVTVGAISGYFGGKVDAVLMRITEMFQVIPRFILALVVVAMLGSGMSRIILVIGFLSWPPSARLIRAQFLALRDREFVQAARVAGTRNRTIIIREMLPNAIAPAVVVGSMDIAQAVLLEASLSFLGLGDPNSVSWGTMIQEAQPYLRDAWWLSACPGVAIFALVLAFNLLGDGINDALSPHQRSPR
jgi:peptide/nickel transport system permease protein